MAWVESARIPAGSAVRFTCRLIYFSQDFDKFKKNNNNDKIKTSRGDSDLCSSQDVVPNRRPSKVNVEIGEATLHTHETVPEDGWKHVNKRQSNHFLTLAYSLLYFGILHVYDGVGGVSLSFLEVSWPHVVNPVYQIHLDR